MKPSSITVIGMGARGMSVFERLAAHARASLCPIQLNLIEPGPCGPGKHATRLPQHLVLDTPAGEVSIFPAAGTVDLPPACVTPTLAQWARAQGYRRHGAEYHRAGDGGAEVQDDDTLPRQLLGRYLAWAYGAVAASLPPTVTLAHLRHRAIDMAVQPDGSFIVELDSGFCVPSDFVFLATGAGVNCLSEEEGELRKFAQDHSRSNSRLAYLRHVLPLEQLVTIAHDADVAIDGSGALARDVLAELTLGRGGRFESVGGGLSYTPSGQEPRITLLSGWHAPARAPHDPVRRARFFTRDAIDDLRWRAQRERGNAQLDFQRELLPLLFKELGYACRCALDAHAPEPSWYHLSADEQAALDALLFPIQDLDPAGAARGDTPSDTLSDAPGDALNAAAAALRQARSLLQECVQHGALLPDSHHTFLRRFHPAFERVAQGQAPARRRQLAALIEAGVVRVAHSPVVEVWPNAARSQFALDSAGTRHVDVLLVAREEVFSPISSDTLLMRNLHKRGTVRPYCNGDFHPGGVDIDGGLHPIGRGAQAAANLWVLGALTEGPLYLTASMAQGEPCVQALFAALDARVGKRRAERRQLVPQL